MTKKNVVLRDLGLEHVFLFIFHFLLALSFEFVSTQLMVFSFLMIILYAFGL